MYSVWQCVQVLVSMLIHVGNSVWVKGLLAHNWLEVAFRDSMGPVIACLAGRFGHMKLNYCLCLWCNWRRNQWILWSASACRAVSFSNKWHVKKALPKYPGLKAFLDTHCHSSQYVFQQEVCGFFFMPVLPTSSSFNGHTSILSSSTTFWCIKRALSALHCFVWRGTQWEGSPLTPNFWKFWGTICVIGRHVPLSHRAVYSFKSSNSYVLTLTSHLTGMKCFSKPMQGVHLKVPRPEIRTMKKNNVGNARGLYYDIIDAWLYSWLNHHWRS